MKEHFRYKNIHFGYLYCTILDDDYESAFCPLFWDNDFELFSKYGMHPYPNTVWRKSKKTWEKEIGRTFPMQQDWLSPRAEKLGLRYSDFHACTQFYPVSNYYTIHKEYTYYLKNNMKFIIPLVIDTSKYYRFTDPTKLTLPADMLEAIHSGQATIVIFQPHEGYFHIKEQAIWINNFAEHFNLNKNSLKILTSNLIAKEVFAHYGKELKVKLNFDIVTDTYFEHFPWWFHDNKYESINRDVHYKNFNESLEYNRTKLKSTHFLSLMRRPADHRVLLKALFLANPALYNNKSSLGNIPSDGIKQCSEFILRNFDLTGFRYPDKMKEIISRMDKLAPFSVDRDDFGTNFATDINVNLQNSCFVNIVTETDHIANSVFLSEKMFKPIYTASPFIVIGNKGTLRELKKLGYKTFDRWWDESYDEIDNIADRLVKLEEILETIGSWDLDKLWEVTQEMEEVLIHNFNNFMDCTRMKKINEFMYDLSHADGYNNTDYPQSDIQRDIQRETTVL